MEEDNYIVIKSTSMKEFQDRVNESIKEGYKVCGNMIVYGDHIYPNFYQSLCKKEDIAKI